MCTGTQYQDERNQTKCKIALEEKLRIRSTRDVSRMRFSNLLVSSRPCLIRDSSVRAFGIWRLHTCLRIYAILARKSPKDSIGQINGLQMLINQSLRLNSTGILLGSRRIL